MSLAALAKSLKPSTQFDRHPLSKQFSEKFPIITLDLEEMADRKVHEDQDMSLNENLERQIREHGDRQQKRTNVKASTPKQCPTMTIIDILKILEMYAKEMPIAKNK